MTRRAKSLLWALAPLVIFTLAIWGIVAGGYANGIIRPLAERELTEWLGKPVGIGRIEGNPLGRYRVLHVDFGAQFQVDTIDVVYSFGDLLMGRAVVDSVAFKDMAIKVPSEPQASNESTWWRTVPPFDIEIRWIDLERGSVEIDSTEIKNIALTGQFLAGDEGYRVAVARFRSVQFEPPLEIMNLSGLGILANGDLQLQDVAMLVGRSQLSLHGFIRNLSDPELDIRFASQRLALDDLVMWRALPSQIIQANGSLKGPMHQIATEVVIKSGGSNVTFEGQMGFSPFAVTGEYRLDLTQFAPREWGMPVDFPLVFDLNGNGAIKSARGDEWEVDFSGLAKKLILGEAVFDSIAVATRLSENALQINLDAQGKDGQIQFDGEMNLEEDTVEGMVQVTDAVLAKFPHIPEEMGKVTGKIRFSKENNWQGDATLSYLEIGDHKVNDVLFASHLEAQVLKIEQLKVSYHPLFSQIQGQGQIDFGGTEPVVAIAVNGRVDVYKIDQRIGTLMVFEGTIDGATKPGYKIYLKSELDGNAAVAQFIGDAVIQDAEVLQGKMVVSGPAGTLTGQGQIGPGTHIGVSWQADRLHVSAIGDWAGMDLYGGQVGASGAVWGQWGALGYSAKAHADTLQVNGVPIHDVTLDTRWTRPDSGAVSVKAAHLDWGDRPLYDIILSATYDRGRSSFLIASEPQAENRIYFWGNTTQEKDQVSVAVDSLHVQVGDVALYNDGHLAFAYAPTRGVQIGQFALAGPAGRLEARDQDDFQATMAVVLSDLDLRPWAFLGGVGDVEGVLNGTFDIAGTVSDPLVFGEFILKQGEWMGMGIEETTGEVSFGDGRMMVEAEVVSGPGHTIDLVGSFPIGTSGDIRLRGQANDFGLAILDTLVSEWGSLDGQLDFDLEARGSFDNPDLYGEIKLIEGMVHLPSLNRRFEPVAAHISARGQRLEVKQVSLGPSATITGEVNLKGFVPASWDISAQFDHFEPVTWPELQIVTQGNLKLSGTPKSSKLAGHVHMSQGEIRLGQLVDSPVSIWDTSPFLRNLDMHIQLDTERQVWVRDPTFDVEMAGDVDVIKQGEGLQVYGTMRSRRGNYILQNRRLRIGQGELVFVGRPGVNPNLNIQAETQVRGRLWAEQERDVVTVKAQVQGTLTHPQVSLTSDPMPQNFENKELNLMTFLVTGKNADDLRNPDAADVGAVVLGIAANRLGQQIGQHLNLDLVEVDLNEANISRIRVGKYLGDQLFATYAQDLSTTSKEIGLEFEVMRGLTLEAHHEEEVEEETKNKRTRQSLGMFWTKEW